MANEELNDTLGYVGSADFFTGNYGATPLN